MPSKKHTKNFLCLLLLSTSFAPLNGSDIDFNGSDIDSIYSCSEARDKEESTPPPLILEDKNQLVRTQLAKIAENLQPLIDFFKAYENSPSCEQELYDQDQNPLKALYDFEKILEKIKKCKYYSNQLYSHSLILLELSPKLVNLHKDLTYLTEMLSKHCAMFIYTKVPHLLQFATNREDVYPKKFYFDPNIDKIIGKLKCTCKVKRNKRHFTNASNVTNMAVSPDDASLVWVENLKNVYLWNIEKGKPVLFEGNSEFIKQLIWSSEGDLFFSTSWRDHIIRIWSKKDKKLIKKLEVAKARLHAMCHSKHGLFIGNSDGNLYVVNKFEEEPKVEELVRNSNDKKCAISNLVSLGDCILYRRGKKIWIYDVCKGEERDIQVGVGVSKIEASPNGKYLAFIGDKMLEIFFWDQEKKQLDKKPIKESTHSYSKIRFSHDSRFLFAQCGNSLMAIEIFSEQRVELLHCEVLLDSASFNHCNRFVTVSRDKNFSSDKNYDTMIRTWGELPLQSIKASDPNLNLVRNLFRTCGVSGSCVYEIFALIIDYVLGRRLSFSWVWEK